MNAREKKIQIDDCNKLTEHLIVVLPKLLNKVFIPHLIIVYFCIKNTLISVLHNYDNLSFFDDVVCIVFK